MDIAAEIASKLAGHRALEITRRESDDWLLRFENDARLEIHWPWRVAMGGRLAFGVDECRQQLLNRTVEGVAIREGTADITIAFSGGILLEVTNHSDGYEGWQFGGDRLLVVAAGTGDLSVWKS